jgi:hypothetical protein
MAGKPQKNSQNWQLKGCSNLAAKERKDRKEFFSLLCSLRSFAAKCFLQCVDEAPFLFKNFNDKAHLTSRP